jgi:hypothetical protein
MRGIAQKIGRLVLRKFCRALTGRFRAHAFLKSTCTDFVEGGLVQAVLERAALRWMVNTHSAAQPLALVFAKYARGCLVN